MSSVSLAFLCRWWRQLQINIVSRPPTTAPLPSTLWCSSAGRTIAGNGRASTRCSPPWIDSSGTPPPSRWSQLGETGASWQYIPVVIPSVLTFPLLAGAALSHCSAPRPQTWRPWQQSVIGWRLWGWRDIRMSLIRHTSTLWTESACSAWSKYGCVLHRCSLREEDWWLYFYLLFHVTFMLKQVTLNKCSLTNWGEAEL